MNTAAATATKEPAPPPPIRPLIQEGRISPEGHKNLEPCWLTFKTPDDIDRFLAQPGPWLDGGTDYVQPFTVLHCVDDHNQLYVMALCLMVRLGGAQADVVELVRKQLPAALPFVSSPGWSISHNAAYGWHVTKDGVVVTKLTNLKTEHAARAAMNIEVENSRNRR